MQDRGRPPDKRLPERRCDHSFGAALEQRCAELPLQVCNAARERRLRDAEVARGGTQAAVLGYGGDIVELDQFHW
jgi:hypothetical protein